MDAISPSFVQGAAKQALWDLEQTMFPEIARDDVFRLETRRLWLRWPVTADYQAIPSDPAGIADGGPRPDRNAAQAKPAADIAQWREDMEQGTSLHLMLTAKNGAHEPIGIVHLAGDDSDGLQFRCWLVPHRRREGLMTEAAQAVVDTAFLLNAASEISASPYVLDGGFRRVLERCGFAYVGNGMRNCQSGRGLAACDQFRLARKTWVSLRNWRPPDPKISAAGAGVRIDPIGISEAG